MNYRDYMEIMDSEGISLPKIAEYTLDGAKSCQRMIKALKRENKFDTDKQVKKLEEKKIGYILEAIEWARLAKEMPAEFEWADKQLEK